jgi:hypothetical protein
MLWNAWLSERHFVFTAGGERVNIVMLFCIYYSVRKAGRSKAHIILTEAHIKGFVLNSFVRQRCRNLYSLTKGIYLKTRRVKTENETSPFSKRAN